MAAAGFLVGNSIEGNGMNDSELLESLIYSTHHAAGFILRRMRRVPPAGLYFKNSADPLMDYYFPREDQAKASDEELRGLVVEKLQRWAARPDTCAIAFATEVVVDGQRMMALQAETRTEVIVLHYPIRKTWLGLKLGAPQKVDELLVNRLLSQDR